MPDKKKHHYVPKFYLREFANDKGEFTIYNLKDGNYIEAVPYKDQCYKNYFYGKDGIWEDQLGEMETKWGILFRKIKEREVLLEDDIELIKQFAMYQRHRTHAEDEYIKRSRVDMVIECGKMLYANKGWIFDEEAEQICKERALSETTPAENLEVAMSASKYLDDLDVVVINYKTSSELISSDVPVVAINQFHQLTIGYACMGLILFFPISRHQLVVIYDGKMYSRFRNKQYMDIEDENEVYNLNAFQYVSAETILFSYRADELCDFSNSVKEAREKCRNKKTISTLGPEQNKIIYSGMRLTLYDCELSFGQLSHQYRRIPFTCREAVSRQWDEGWERKLNIKEQVIMAIMREKPQIMADSGLTKKDLKLGYRRMASVAKNYWNLQKD